ncbi:MotA/TolQ/ExbB proton channel family protein [Thermoleptolyngbya sp. C42_A2020_037]|uniref:MotA/TolQ/ExbB proton channel family protein n=1 Tax=Thermoleptolyngbya sp. C42_A2020_037 TaxID=2747799 RepID=UPI0019EB6C6A|nr:MotA/TolQ/ExbB proton channel family protein [Thermoleptolyngbya sp. C42_A2020_037]MBF2083011.1 MotA/TolQ/ExbB proton channel family protein [Thermoleptolyngbya sp. C42_A2020_037]
MAALIDLVMKGGPVMIPIVGFSVATVACGLERAWYWYRLLTQENQVVQDVLEAARHDLAEAEAIAEQSQDVPIGRFLLAPLRLRQPSPETFRLAMEAAGDREFAEMRKGDKLLETTIAVSPLLGLLGTVTGLINTFNNLNIGGGGGEGTSAQATRAAAGIGEALITTAAGMVVAIMALLIFRLLVSLQARQMDYFSAAGSELELIYRQFWDESELEDEEVLEAIAPSGRNPLGIERR